MARRVGDRRPRGPVRCRASGSAERSVVRRDNLLHSATAVLVRDPDGRIYVHRRSPDKDWAPGVPRRGGRRGAHRTARSRRRRRARELAEELGITGADAAPAGAVGLRGRHHPVRRALLRDDLGRPGRARGRRGGLGRLDDAARARRSPRATRAGRSCRTPGRCWRGWPRTASATTGARLPVGEPAGVTGSGRRVAWLGRLRYCVPGSCARSPMSRTPQATSAGGDQRGPTRVRSRRTCPPG